MKKNYQQPEMRVVLLQHRTQLLTVSEKPVGVSKVSSNLQGSDDFEFVGSDVEYTGGAR